MQSKFLLLVAPEDNNEVLAFVMFRFEWDDEDEPEYPVLFLYELQVAKSAQRLGLGRYLMKAVDKVCVFFFDRRIIYLYFYSYRVTPCFSRTNSKFL